MRLVAGIALVALASGGSSCATEDARVYDNNDLQLVTSYTAKDMCSCLFVQQMSEEYCRAWTKASPAVADVRINADARRVEAGALLLWIARARYLDETRGCVLE